MAAGPRGGVVLDIGTGDGRFVLAMARAFPEKFFVGSDANAKPLEKISMRATRKPAKGGLANAIFAQASIEDLPEEFDGLAGEIHINFPWGSLLRAVAVGDENALAALRRVSVPGGTLRVVIGVDGTRDRAELARLGVTVIDEAYIRSELIPKYRTAGFDLLEYRELGRSEWSRIETTWARKLSSGSSRNVFSLTFTRVADDHLVK